MAVVKTTHGGAWMGSHITNDDLVKSNRIDEDYQFTLLEETEEFWSWYTGLSVVPTIRELRDHGESLRRANLATLVLRTLRAGEPLLAATDQLRTSRLDADVQYFMTMLPYQAGDVRGAGNALPGALSRS